MKRVIVKPVPMIDYCMGLQPMLLTDVTLIVRRIEIEASIIVGPPPVRRRLFCSSRDDQVITP